MAVNFENEQFFIIVRNPNIYGETRDVVGVYASRRRWHWWSPLWSRPSPVGHPSRSYGSLPQRNESASSTAHGLRQNMSPMSWCWESPLPGVSRQRMGKWNHALHTTVCLVSLDLTHFIVVVEPPVGRNRERKSVFSLYFVVSHAYEFLFSFCIFIRRGVWVATATDGVPIQPATRSAASFASHPLTEEAVR